MTDLLSATTPLTVLSAADIGSWIRLAAQAVTDADGWRVWRVGVHGAHLGDLRDDLADRSF